MGVLVWLQIAPDKRNAPGLLLVKYYPLSGSADRGCGEANGRVWFFQV